MLTSGQNVVQYSHELLAIQTSDCSQTRACKQTLAGISAGPSFFSRTPCNSKTNRLWPKSPSVAAQELRANGSLGRDCRQGLPPMKHVRSVAFRIVEGLQASRSLDPEGSIDHGRDCPQPWPSSWRAALRERADLLPDRNGETRSKMPATSSLKLVALSQAGRAADRTFLSPKLMLNGVK